MSERPELSDPLAQIVGLLRPDLSHSKLVEGAGAWRVCRSERGRAFFCVVTEGVVSLAVDGREPFAVRAGDFVLIPSIHEFVAESTVGAASHPPARLPAEIRPNVFRLGDTRGAPDVRMLVGYCAFGSTDAALLVTLLPALLHARGERRLTALLQLAVDESRADRPARDVILQRLMEVLFIEALRSAGPPGRSGILHGLGDDQLAAAIRHIHAEPTARWTLATLAKVAGMSRSAFADRFRRSVGLTPMSYLLQWRMTLAKELLRLRQGSLAEIAHRTGYGSASALSVAFTRHVGTPPSLYARETLPN